ncbi:Pore-forming peptide ameobapore B precursor, putative [Entamoeba invadens IP1]|uniref:Pore-forming peptide ameobapore B, putative n=1 Tax=Entamoeba invadens IP1 TaxID=370355 RepID=A0A0A1TU70_ENTIV|nr:Pore-forming peptide ameobapore B precursor, putative [Entamoeba invadens IP1]ELP83459.1 Pore-forming peptide ameobapore B precursor, putative [Entamoeba invadens IP1]|eukprot:XP_004182805.1 Pore-forming peptide ameobapore B precursor, putative [Entamoeba invadens IP1]
MRAFVIFAIIACVFAAREGVLICNLCKDTVDMLEKLLVVDGADAVRQYITELCDGVSGFLGTLCTSFLNFGVDEIIKMIENNVDKVTICQNLGAC